MSESENKEVEAENKEVESENKEVEKEQEYSTKDLIKLGMPVYEEINKHFKNKPFPPFDVLLGCLLKVISMSSGGNRAISMQEIINILTPLVGYRDAA